MESTMGVEDPQFPPLDDHWNCQLRRRKTTSVPWPGWWGALPGIEFAQTNGSSTVSIQGTYGLVMEGTGQVQGNMKRWPPQGLGEPGTGLRLVGTFPPCILVQFQVTSVWEVGHHELNPNFSSLRSEIGRASCRERV